MKITCQVKSVSTKACVSGDTTTRIVLEQDNLSQESLNELNAICASPLNMSREIEVWLVAVAPGMACNGPESV